MIDPSAVIAPTARVHPEAVIGPQCVIGEYCVVEADTVMGRGNRLEPYVFVKRWTTLGDENEISAGACLGTDPFDRAFKGERSYLTIGDRNIIREHWTISRGTKPEARTVIGHDNYIMGSGHIAHDCVVGNGCTIASCSLLAGYVTVEDQAFISGGVVVHQFSRIGRLVMVGGNTRVNSDLAPYFLYTDFNVAVQGLNVVGLRRAGFNASQVKALKQAYRILYRSGLGLADALTRLETELGESEHVSHLVKFVRSSKRGIAREARESVR